MGASIRRQRAPGRLGSANPVERGRVPRRQSGDRLAVGLRQRDGGNPRRAVVIVGAERPVEVTRAVRRVVYGPKTRFVIPTERRPSDRLAHGIQDFEQRPDRQLSEYGVAQVPTPIDRVAISPPDLGAGDVALSN